jgi:hypothetical protein
MPARYQQAQLAQPRSTTALWQQRHGTPTESNALGRCSLACCGYLARLERSCPQGLFPSVQVQASSNVDCTPDVPDASKASSSAKARLFGGSAVYRCVRPRGSRGCGIVRDAEAGCTIGVNWCGRWGPGGAAARRPTYSIHTHGSVLPGTLYNSRHSSGDRSDHRRPSGWSMHDGRRNSLRTSYVFGHGVAV